MTRKAPAHIEAGYGRSKPRLPEKVADRDEPRCAKCRHLVLNGSAGCGKGHALDPATCGEFSDCSRQRDYMPHFYHSDMRR